LKTNGETNAQLCATIRQTTFQTRGAAEYTRYDMPLGMSTRTWT